MRRRKFIALLGGTAVAGPLTAHAQQTVKLRRVGFLTSAPRPNSIGASYLSGFPRGMRELGYVEGRDYVIDWRFAEGRLERFADFAAELVRLNVDIFVLGTPTAIPAVRQATTTIPVVMGYSTDPVGNGFIASLAHPGGNITGLASSQDDAAPKQLELLMTAVPNLSRVALLVDPSSPNSLPIVKNAQAAAQKAGLDLVRMEARSVQELEHTSSFGETSDETPGVHRGYQRHKRMADERRPAKSASYRADKA